MKVLNQELQALFLAYPGLSIQSKLRDESVVVGGIVSFKAKSQNCEEIEDVFKLSICINNEYPNILPQVHDLGDRFHASFEHVTADGALGLDISLEEADRYQQQPSLLSFVDHLVVPFLYGYAYWERYGRMPFGE